MLDIYICEDNTTQREAVSAFISNYCDSQKLDASIVLASPTPTEVLSHFKNNQNPVLFFLDIDLKASINGIELGRKIRETAEPEQKVFIVFLTTHTEMTLMTFQYKLEALDFIAKDKQGDIKRKIKECIDTAMQRHIGSGKAKSIQLTVNDKIIQLGMDEIICIESTHIRHKLRLYTQSRSMEFNGELKNIEERLDERFIRCHKSFIINKDKIAHIDKKDNTVVMVNNCACPISKNGKKLL